jgi:uncharacterized iron-regulated membrane protein
MEKPSLYRTIWRWHFYAGLFVLPFILILSVTGSIYLFKPQIDHWQESEWRGLPTQNGVGAERQLAVVMAANPGAHFRNYRLPQDPGDAAVVHIGLSDGVSMRDVYVSPQGKFLASIDPESRISSTVARIHGSLMIGKWGSYLLELAASWTIVMILSGLYLWWPRGQGLAGVLWPRLGLGKRGFWRDIHAVTGFWVSGLALVTLASGLPWTDVWASGFKIVRAEMGWLDAKPQDWKGSGDDPHFAHDHTTMMANGKAPASLSSITLNEIVRKARAEAMPSPAIIIPPGAPMRFGPPNGADWKFTSEAQNRTVIRSVTFDAQTGAETGRSDFADKHILDRIINTGIAWHEGQLFGWFNQLIGLLTAFALIGLAVSSIHMWWRRKPKDSRWFDLGAPPKLKQPGRIKGIALIGVIAALMLPMIALSLAVIFLADRCAQSFVARPVFN